MSKSSPPWRDWRDDSVETVIRSLRDVESCARSHHGQFKPYLPLIVPTLCSLVDDSIEFVAAHAFKGVEDNLLSR